MSFITNRNVENRPNDNNQQIDDVRPVDRVDPTHAQTFSNLVDERDEVQTADATEESGDITPEELQRQIRENLFKNGFTRAIERAREIAKELREG